MDIEAIAFILAQKGELLRHIDFLRITYNWQCSEHQAACDWANRYAADYRHVGNKLLDLIGHDHPRKVYIFELGMCEIMNHKFIESQKAGHDIGLWGAGDDWLNKHLTQWFVEHGFGAHKP
jgi:hypothetical protein